MTFILNLDICLTSRHKVNALIDRANELWDERNANAVAEGEAELEPMLPLIRLKVAFPFL